MKRDKILFAISIIFVIFLAVRCTMDRQVKPKTNSNEVKSSPNVEVIVTKDPEKKSEVIITNTPVPTKPVIKNKIEEYPFVDVN